MAVASGKTARSVARSAGSLAAARQEKEFTLVCCSMADMSRTQARTVAEELLRDQPQAADAHLGRWLAGREELLKA